jgi:AAA family ATP:ADP antiporter
MVLVSAGYSKALKRIGLYSVIRVTSLVAAGSFLLFWWLVAHEARASFYILYVWVSLFGGITASQAWSLANYVFDAREARRFFAWIGLGGVVGGIVGGSLARVVALWRGTELLLPICAALMIVTVGILHSLVFELRTEGGQRLAAETGKLDDSHSVFEEIRSSRYLSLLIAVLLSGVVVEAFIDFEFKVVARQAFDSKDHLTSFFGTIASVGGILALLFQVLVTGRLLKRFGVSVATVLLPAALLASFVVIAVRPALWAVSLLKLVDGCLSYSVHRSGMELLYVPIPARIRASAKAFIDLLVDRAGRAAGGLILLVLTSLLSFSIPSLSVVAAIFLAVWIVLAVLVRSDYVQAFRVMLEKKVIEPEALEFRTLDSTMTAALVQALSSSDDRQVLYALNLLGNLPGEQWDKYLPALIEHKSSAVRGKAISQLTEHHSYSPELVSSRLLDPALDVRIEAVRHLCVLGSRPPEVKLREFVEYTDYRVVLAAIHCMAKYRLGGPDIIDEPLVERALNTTGEYAVTARRAAAGALALASLPRTPELIDRLLEDPNPEVVRQAIRTAGEIRCESAIPRLISLLERSSLRRDSGQALIKLGPTAITALKHSFQDDRTPLEVRVRIPKVFAFSQDPETAKFLVFRIHHSTPRLDTPLLKALNRMRAKVPDLSFDLDEISSVIREECSRHLHLRRIKEAMESGAPVAGNAIRVHSLLIRAIDERLAESSERVLRLLALIYSPDDIQTVYYNFSSRSALKPSAMEFLDNLIDPGLSTLVMPVLEDYTDASSKITTKDPEMLRHEALLDLCAGSDEWLKTIATDLAARLIAEDTAMPRPA